MGTRLTLPRYIFFNGGWVHEDACLLPAASRGVRFGESLFETLLAESGHCYQVEEHVARLVDSAQALRVPLRLPGGRVLEAGMLEEWVREAGARAQQAGLSTARVRLTLWNRDGRCSDLHIHPEPYQPPQDAERRRGWHIKGAPVPLPGRTPLLGRKTGNYWPWNWAREWARREGADDALLLAADGSVAELATANLFIYNRGRWSTPSLDSGCLPGVARRWVLELLHEDGERVEERPLSVAEVAEAEEACATNSLIGVMPVVALNGRPIGAGMPGPRTERLWQRYRRALDDERRRKGRGELRPLL